MAVDEDQTVATAPAQREPAPEQDAAVSADDDRKGAIVQLAPDPRRQQRRVAHKPVEVAEPEIVRQDEGVGRRVDGTAGGSIKPAQETGGPKGDRSLPDARRMTQTGRLQAQI